VVAFGDKGLDWFKLKEGSTQVSHRRNRVCMASISDTREELVDDIYGSEAIASFSSVPKPPGPCNS
jgi:hypothetical protein